MDTRVKALGKEWAISGEMSVGALLAFRDWVAAEVGDPFAALEDAIRFKRPEEEQRALYEQGKAVKEQLRCFSLKTELGQRYLYTEAGSLKFTELMLRDAYPEITNREVAVVTMAYGEQAPQPPRKPEGNGQAPLPLPAATA